METTTLIITCHHEPFMIVKTMIHENGIVGEAIQTIYSKN